MVYKRDLANPLAPTYGDEKKPKKKKEYVYKSDYDKKVERESAKYGTLVKQKDTYSRKGKNKQKRKYVSDDYVTKIKQVEGKTDNPTIKRRKKR